MVDVAKCIHGRSISEPCTQCLARLSRLFERDHPGPERKLPDWSFVHSMVDKAAQRELGMES
jgi:hypothetical protein